MHIRGLTWKELPMWPPEWGILDHGVGEAGVLANVQFRNDLTPACIFVVANDLGHIRKGIIILEALTHLGPLYRKLKENIGKPLIEIGNLEIDFHPPLRKSAQKQAYTAPPETLCSFSFMSQPQGEEYIKPLNPDR
jgi:hypothetical protein